MVSESSQKLNPPSYGLSVANHFNRLWLGLYMGGVIMPHFSYQRTAERLAKSHWGRDFADEEAAKKSLSHDMDLTGACLLSLMNRMDRIMAAILKDQERQAKGEIQDKIYTQFQDFMLKREAKHGPCPGVVSRALYKLSRLEMADDYFCGFEHINLTTILPEKGTKARREYDKWMKRKAPKPKP